MLKDFKDFISQGDVVSLAVAVVIAIAFGNVITSFIDDILLQVVAAIVGEPDFSGLTFGLGDAVVRYGNFITVLVSFIIIAAAVFLVVKVVDKMRKAPDAGPSELDVLKEIRDSVKR